MAVGDRAEDRSLLGFVLWRALLVATVVVLCTSLVFVYVHFGPNPPVEETSGEGAAMVEKKESFGLLRPMWIQYVDYLTDMATFDFGDSWSSRHLTESLRTESDDVDTLLETYGARTLWLWGWTLAVAAAVGLPLGFLSGRRRSEGEEPGDPAPPGDAGDERVGLTGSALLRAAPVVLVAPLLRQLLLESRSLFFGVTWTGWLVETGTLSGPIQFGDLAVATKLALPPAAALSVPFVGTAVVVGRRATLAARSSGHADAARGFGVPPHRLFRRHVLRNALLPFVTTLRRNAAALLGATLVVEQIFSLQGMGTLLYLATGHGDYTTLQATLFLTFCFLGGVALLQDSLVAWLGGGRTGRKRRARACWTGSETNDGDGSNEGGQGPSGLRVLRGRGTDGSVLTRVRADPRPALLWLGVGGVLFAMEVGAVVDVLGTLLQFPVPDVPTLLDRSNVPNEGYHVPGEGWRGTAFGLSPALALALRVGLVGAYALAWAGWLGGGWRLYRSRYRLADWTPTDAAIRRFTGRRVAVLSLVVVATLFVTALFAPTMAATPIGRTETHADLQQMPLTEPNDSARLTYFDEEAGEVRTSSVGLANMNVESEGTPESNVGPLSYDRYDRFHPFGTTFSGTDLYSEMVVGARVYAAVGGLGAVVVSGIAVALALVASRVRGRVEATIEGLASAVAALPQLVVLYVLLAVADRTVITDAGTTLLVMAGLFGVLGWTDLWQTLRTPAYRALDAGWRDDSRLLGRPGVGVGRGVRRLAGIVLAYATTAFAGIVLTTTGFAAVSSTIWTSTAAWGEFYLYGIDQLTTVSGHTAVVPGVAVVVLIASAIVLADGIRAATETGQELGSSAPGEVSALGGGG